MSCNRVSGGHGWQGVQGGAEVLDAWRLPETQDRGAGLGNQEPSAA